MLGFVAAGAAIYLAYKHKDVILSLFKKKSPSDDKQQVQNDGHRPGQQTVQPLRKKVEGSYFFLQLQY